MAKIILHVGTHKTATTTIQNSFHQNAALLAKHGVIYPQIGKATGHHGLLADWYRDLPKSLHYPQGSRAMWRDIADRYAKGDHTVFISSETLSVGHPNGAPNYAEIRALLAPFEAVQVLCLVREQWQFMQSLFLEVGKKTAPPPPVELVRKALAGEYCLGMWTDYVGFHDRLLTAFSTEEIRFLDFDVSRKTEGGILGQVLREIGCDLRAEDLIQGNGRANPSPPALPAWAAAMSARPAAAPVWLLAEAEAAFQAEFGEDVRSCLFSRQEYDALARHFTPINDRLAERLAPRHPGFFVSQTPEAQARDLVFRNRITAAFWMRLTRRVTRKLLSTPGS